MYLGSSAEVSADGFRVCFAFSFDFCKASVSGITGDFRQRWMLEEGLSVFEDGRDCLR